MSMIMIYRAIKHFAYLSLFKLCIFTTRHWLLELKLVTYTDK